MYYSVTQNGNIDIILSLENGFMTLVKNEKVLYAGMTSHINSAVFDGIHLIFTKQNVPNFMVANIISGDIREITLSSITSVIKLIGIDNRYLVYNNCNCGVCIYDLLNMEPLCEIPLKNKFYDISCTEEGLFTVIGEEAWWDDDELEDVYEMLRRFTVGQNGETYLYSNTEAREFKDTLRDIGVDSYAFYRGRIKLPLFDRYFKAWPYYKKVTPHCALHYCSDIKCMIVSSLENGNVICMFCLPEGIRSENCIAFNEESYILTEVSSNGRKVTRYQIIIEDATTLEEMNLTYNKAYESNTWLRQDDKFNKLVLAARDGCKLVRIN